MTWDVEASGYFITLPEWLEESGVSDKALRLWCKLQKRANIERGRAGMTKTRQDLADLMGCSKDTVDRLVKELEGAEALEVERAYDPIQKRSFPSTYRVLLDRPQAVDSAVDEGEGGGRKSAATRTAAARGGRTDPDVSSSKRTNPQNAPAAPAGGGRSASSSSRPSRSPRAASDPRTTGLTPGTSPTPQPPAPADSADPARRLADEVAAHGKAVTNVRQMAAVFRLFLAKGETVDTLRPVAMVLRCITEGTMGVALDNRDRQARPAGRPPRPAPPVVTASPEPKSRLTPEEFEAVKKRNAELRQQRADARKAREAEQSAAAGLTLVPPAEEVPA
jgi:hypothetical protein